MNVQGALTSSSAGKAFFGSIIGARLRHMLGGLDIVGVLTGAEKPPSEVVRMAEAITAIMENESLLPVIKTGVAALIESQNLTVEDVLKYAKHVAPTVGIEPPTDLNALVGSIGDLSTRIITTDSALNEGKVVAVFACPQCHFTSQVRT